MIRPVIWALKVEETVVFVKKYKKIYLVMIVFLTFANCYGVVVDSDNWRYLGNQVVYFFDSSRCPVPDWLRQNNTLADSFSRPDVRESVLAEEAFLEKALEGYEEDSLIWYGRIALDINPKCVLGLYIADKYEGTKLGALGKRQFEQCIERSCLAVFEGDSGWQEVLESELAEVNRDLGSSFEPENFEQAEVPFLLIYLIDRGGSELVRQRAGECLAREMVEQYGLEPALRQHRVLAGKQGATVSEGQIEQLIGKLIKVREDDEILSLVSQNTNETTPDILMREYARVGDYFKAEEYGIEALKILKGKKADNKEVSVFSSRLERVDNFLFVLCSELRGLGRQKSKLSGASLNNYSQIIKVLQNLLATDFGSTGDELEQLFWKIKNECAVQLLSAEYELAKTRQEAGGFKKSFKLEPIIFTAQLLRGNSFEQMRKELSDAADPEFRKGQMYRFAQFSQQTNHRYIARMALDAAVQEIDKVCDNVELLKDIAGMYLSVNSHQKAIEIYERIIAEVSDRDEAAMVLLEVIKIYSEKLRLYDKAIVECQRFLTEFPDAEQVSKIEFLTGKLAYLNKDYGGATGQLDMFCKKYGGDLRTGEAMILAALSRMSEGNTEDAIERFKEIIQKYPNSDLAIRSKFLIGYSQVSEQKYSQALEAFQQLVEQFPNSKYTSQAQSFINRLGKLAK